MQPLLQQPQLINGAPVIGRLPTAAPPPAKVTPGPNGTFEYKMRTSEFYAGLIVIGLGIAFAAGATANGAARGIVPLIIPGLIFGVVSVGVGAYLLSRPWADVVIDPTARMIHAKIGASIFVACGNAESRQIPFTSLTAVELKQTNTFHGGRRRGGMREEFRVYHIILRMTVEPFEMILEQCTGPQQSLLQFTQWQGFIASVTGRPELVQPPPPMAFGVAMMMPQPAVVVMAGPQQHYHQQQQYQPQPGGGVMLYGQQQQYQPQPGGGVAMYGQQQQPVQAAYQPYPPQLQQHSPQHQPSLYEQAPPQQKSF